MENLKVTVENGVKTLEIRTGDALSEVSYKGFQISGTVITPLEHLNKTSDVDYSKTFLEVDLEKGYLKLCEKKGFCRGTDSLENVYIGQLELTADFQKFGINTGKSYTTFQLADLFKMNRFFFETKNEAMKLVTELRNFKAKVDRDIELSDDTRGNAAVKKIQAVESNIPDSFKLKMAIFKGQPALKFNVEVAIDPDDLSCSLVSPDANDYQQCLKEKLIQDVVDEIRTIHPDLRIFYV